VSSTWIVNLSEAKVNWGCVNNEATEGCPVRTWRLLRSSRLALVPVTRVREGDPWAQSEFGPHTRPAFAPFTLHPKRQSPHYCQVRALAWH
jgi:hypothetical protein